MEKSDELKNVRSLTSLFKTLSVRLYDDKLGLAVLDVEFIMVGKF